MIYQRYDEFKQQSFYRHKAFFKESPIEVYIGYKSEKYYRIKFIYEGSDWIFFESATIVNADGESLRFSFQSFDKITNVMSNGFVFESIDEPLSEDRVKKLLKIIEGNSRYVKVRLSGMYYKDYTLNEKHIKGLLEILNYKSF